MQRIGIQGIRKDPWFKKNYVPVKSRKDGEVSLEDVNAVFNDIAVSINSFCCYYLEIRFQFNKIVYLCFHVFI